MIRTEKVAEYVEEKMIRQQEEKDKRKNLATSVLIKNFEVNDATNDDPDPISKGGEQAQMAIVEGLTEHVSSCQKLHFQKTVHYQGKH